jgi:hypothetical protein
MLRYLPRALTLFGCCIFAACQSYTTGLQKSEARADETAAIAALHSISMAQRTYSISNGSFGTFSQLVQAGALDSRFNSDQPKVGGYVLTMIVTPKSDSQPEGSYMINADPEGVSARGGRHLYLDSASTVIRVNASQPAGANDQPLQ